MLDKLLELARDRGFVMYDEILALLPNPIDNVAELDQLQAVLHARGIDVKETPVDAPTIPAMRVPTLPPLPPLPPLSALTPHNDDEPVTAQEQLADVALDDPVRMYLQEIGQVPLLTAAQEVTLAKAMESGTSPVIRLRARPCLPMCVAPVNDRSKAVSTHGDI